MNFKKRAAINLFNQSSQRARIRYSSIFFSSSITIQFKILYRMCVLSRALSATHRHFEKIIYRNRKWYIADSLKFARVFDQIQNPKMKKQHLQVMYVCYNLHTYIRVFYYISHLTRAVNSVIDIDGIRVYACPCLRLCTLGHAFHNRIFTTLQYYLSKYLPWINWYVCNEIYAGIFS